MTCLNDFEARLPHTCPLSTAGVVHMRSQLQVVLHMSCTCKTRTCNTWENLHLHQLYMRALVHVSHGVAVAYTSTATTCVLVHVVFTSTVELNMTSNDLRSLCYHKGL